MFTSLKCAIAFKDQEVCNSLKPGCQPNLLPSNSLTSTRDSPPTPYRLVDSWACSSDLGPGNDDFFSTLSFGTPVLGLSSTAEALSNRHRFLLSAIITGKIARNAMTATPAPTPIPTLAPVDSLMDAYDVETNGFAGCYPV